MVEYLAARCGFKCVRINNHEHTDVQEYIGGIELLYLIPLHFAIMCIWAVNASLSHY